jgi:mRNA interferase MazF
MPSYQGGEIVLVTFPFVDKAGAKKRPALILRDTGDADIIVARVTSQAPQPDFDVVLAEWQQAGLVLPSVVRVHKLLTLAKRRVEGNVGIVTPRDWAQVRAKVQELWATL